MEDISICYKSLIRANQVQFNLSEELFNISYLLIKERKKLLIDNNCNSFEEFIIKVINLTRNVKYTYQPFNDKKVEVTYSIHTLNKDFLNKNIYLPCFIDNRGRQYYATPLSPTYYKIYRFYTNFQKKKIFIILKTVYFLIK